MTKATRICELEAKVERLVKALQEIANSGAELSEVEEDDYDYYCPSCGSVDVTILPVSRSILSQRET